MVVNVFQIIKEEIKKLLKENFEQDQIIKNHIPNINLSLVKYIGKEYYDFLFKLSKESININDYDELFDFIELNQKMLGYGASKSVFNLNNSFVLKVSEELSSEYNAELLSKYSSLLPKVYDKHEYWWVSERVIPYDSMSNKEKVFPFLFDDEIKQYAKMLGCNLIVTGKQ